MKPIYTLVVLIIIFFTSCKKDVGITIQGTFTNLPEGKLYTYTENTRGITIDSIDFSQTGKFKFEKDITEASIITIMFPDKSYWVPLYILPGENVEINGNSEDVENFQIKGSRVQKDLEAFKRNNQELFEEENRLSKEIDRKTFQGNEGNVDRTRFLSNLNGVRKRIVETAEVYIRKHPDQIVSAIIMDECLVNRGAIPKAYELLDSLQGDAKNFVMTQQLKRQIEEFQKTDVNAKAPDFTVKTIQGDTISLHSFKGKVLLLSFTASWCDFCKLESKTLTKCVQQHNDSDAFDIVSIALDQIDSDWIDYAKEHKITWKQVTDSLGDASFVLQLYNIHEVPYAVLIDRSGTIIGRGNSCDEFRDLLQKEISSHTDN